MRIFPAILILLATPTFAFAHAGHVGELAGHAHWLGLGAAIAAGALAVALAKGRKKDADHVEDEQPIADEAEGDAA